MDNMIWILAKTTVALIVSTTLIELLQDEADGRTRLWHLGKDLVIWYKKTRRKYHR